MRPHRLSFASRLSSGIVPFEMIVSIISNGFFKTIGKIMTLGEELKRLRSLKNLTQKQLAEMVGVKQPAIANIESGISGLSLDVMPEIDSNSENRINRSVLQSISAV